MEVSSRRHGQKNTHFCGKREQKTWRPLSPFMPGELLMCFCLRGLSSGPREKVSLCASPDF